MISAIRLLLDCLVAGYKTGQAVLAEHVNLDGVHDDVAVDIEVDRG